MHIQATVIQNYTSAYPNPITFTENEVVTVSHCDIEWRGWIWISTDSGNAGWAPQQLLIFQPPNKALCSDDYTAHELSAYVNETLILEKSLNGWFWAKKPSGEYGWIPECCVSISRSVES